MFVQMTGIFGSAHPTPFWKLPGVWVFVAALTLRVCVLSRFAASPFFLPESDDMRFYNEWAQRIAAGELTDFRAFYGLPGYAFLLAGIYSLIGFSPFAMGLLQAVCEACTALLVFKLAEHVGSEDENPLANRRARVAGLLGACAWIAFQPAQAFSIVLMPTSWLVTVFWGSLWWTLRQESRVWWSWAVLGVVIGLFATVVATILFLLPLVLARIFVAVTPPPSVRWGHRSLAACALFAGVAGGTSPAWIHNHFIARDPVMLSAHGGLNFWIGNNPQANGYAKIPEGLSAGQAGLLRDSIHQAEAESGRSLKRSEVSKFWAAKAKAYTEAHRGEWVMLLARKVGNFWNAFQYDDLSVVSLFRDEGIIVPGLRFGFIAALALPGILFMSWQNARARWIAAGVLLHMCALLPVFVTERYRLCAVPGMIVLGACYVSELCWALARRQYLLGSAMAAALGVAALLVAMPQREPGLWALEPFNTGLKLFKAGKIEPAKRKLERAYAFVPDNAELNLALGNIWMAKSDSAQAEDFYRRTLELNARHTAALNNLARLNISRRRWAEAKFYIERSIELEPNALKPRYLLAEARFGAGDVGGARAALEQALVLHPGHPDLLELAERIAAQERRQ